MAPAASTELALTDEESRQLDLIHKAIIGEAELPASPDPEAMSRAIMERILAADSFESVFAPQHIAAWRDVLLDVPVVVTDVRFNRSTYEQGSPVYAICDVVDPNGETRTVHCGGANVLAQLVTGLRYGWLVKEGRPVKLVKKETSAGFDALWLEAVA